MCIYIYIYIYIFVVEREREMEIKIEGGLLYECQQPASCAAGLGCHGGETGMRRDEGLRACSRSRFRKDSGLRSAVVSAKVGKVWCMI